MINKNHVSSYLETKFKDRTNFISSISIAKKLG